MEQVCLHFMTILSCILIHRNGPDEDHLTLNFQIESLSRHKQTCILTKIYRQRPFDTFSSTFGDRHLCLPLGWRNLRRYLCSPILDLTERETPFLCADLQMEAHIGASAEKGDAVLAMEEVIMVRTCSAQNKNWCFGNIYCPCLSSVEIFPVQDWSWSLVLVMVLIRELLTGSHHCALTNLSYEARCKCMCMPSIGALIAVWKCSGLPNLGTKVKPLGLASTTLQLGF